MSIKEKPAEFFQWEKLVNILNNDIGLKDGKVAKTELVRLLGLPYGNREKKFVNNCLHGIRTMPAEITMALNHLETILGERCVEMQGMTLTAAWAYLVEKLGPYNIPRLMIGERKSKDKTEPTEEKNGKERKKHSPHRNALQRVLGKYDLSPTQLALVFDIREEERVAFDSYRAVGCKELPKDVYEKAAFLLKFTAKSVKELKAKGGAARAQALNKHLKTQFVENIKEGESPVSVEFSAEEEKTPDAEIEIIPIDRYMQSGVAARLSPESQEKIKQAYNLVGIVAEKNDLPDDGEYHVIAASEDTFLNIFLPDFEPVVE